MNKTRLIAISGVCGALSCVALLLTSLVPYAALIFGVIAAVATTAPMLVDGKYLVYSLLTYAATLTIAAISGIFVGNIMSVAPVALFCVPFAIVKVWGESFKVTKQTEQTEAVAPFEETQETKVVTVQQQSKRRMNVAVRWVVYYILLEAALTLTFVFTWLFARAFFDRIFNDKLIFWLIVGIAQVVVPLYDLLLRGCLLAAEKVIKKVIK